MASQVENCCRFQCPECALGDYEVGKLTRPDEIYCIVCLEQDGRHVRLRIWEEHQARLREDLDAAA